MAIKDAGSENLTHVLVGMTQDLTYLRLRQLNPQEFADFIYDEGEDRDHYGYRYAASTQPQRSVWRFLSNVLTTFLQTTTPAKDFPLKDIFNPNALGRLLEAGRRELMHLTTMTNLVPLPGAPHRLETIPFYADDAVHTYGSFLPIWTLSISLTGSYIIIVNISLSLCHPL